MTPPTTTKDESNDEPSGDRDGGLVRTEHGSCVLVECPYCGDDIQDEPTAKHLKECDATPGQGGAA